MGREAIEEFQWYFLMLNFINFLSSSFKANNYNRGIICVCKCIWEASNREYCPEWGYIRSVNTPIILVLRFLSFMLCPHNIISLFEKMLTWYNTFKGADFMKRLPIGIENFKELITNDYYYVDKTLLIKDVCNEKVVLYTRPRRFHRNSVDTFGIRQEAR